MNLNAEQIAAIGVREGPYCVLATAGSGKTTVLVERVKALFKEGVSQDDLLALTFTVEAAENMEKRIGIKVPKTERSGFRNFHSLGLRLLQNEHRHLPFGLSPDPFPEGNVLAKMLLGFMKEHDVSRKDFREVKAFISRHKRKRTPFDDDLLEFENYVYADIYKQYERALRDGGMLDYDDMIVQAVNLLENNQGVRDRWSFKWLLCDEAQDTDDLQFRMLQLMAEKYGNIFVVGDFCQALYGFRGAHPENLVEFEKWFPGAKTLILPINYRSTKKIVEFCRQHAPLENELTQAMRTDNEEGDDIEFRMFGTPEAEAESTIAVAVSEPGQSAILARTNGQLGVYESLCTENQIKFQRLGRSGFWTQPEIKTLVTLSGFVLGGAQPKNYMQEQVGNYRGFLRRTAAGDAVKEILSISGLENLYASDDYAEEDNYAIANLRTVVRIAERFGNLSQFVNHARRAEHASRKSKNALTLSTVHQAKGLEWKNVFVIGVQLGKLPHERGDMDEEKRIFFVAASRPAKRLRFSFSGTPSEFIKPHLSAELIPHEVEYINKQLSLLEDNGVPIHKQ